MRDFARHRSDRGIRDEGRIALEWAEKHPGEYPFRAYDPKLKGLREKFRKILAKR